MVESEKFTLGFYVHTLTEMLGHPHRFFSEWVADAGFKKPLGFLLLSSLISTGASLVCNSPAYPAMFGTVFFVNAVGMAFIAAGLGYLMMIMMMGRRVTFIRLFSIYALSSGVTLLAAWVPFFLWLTEPWKWWLIGTGMTRSCGFRWVHALLIIGLSIGIMVLCFQFALPLLR